MDEWTVEKRITSDYRWDFVRKHLCTKCNRIFDIDLFDNTTVDLHPCQYAYQDGWETEDNGAGYWVTKCTHYIPLDKKRIYSAWINSEEWENISYIKKKQAGFKCELCGSAINLVCHHITYDHLCMEDKHMKDLLCVCRKCHEKLHEKDIKTPQENAVVKGL